MASTTNSTAASARPQFASLDLPSLFSAKGLVALVTGGGTGIGLVMARALAEAGAKKVYIAGRRLDVLKEAAASIEAVLAQTRSAGGSAASSAAAVVVPLELDVASKDSLAAAARHIEADLGYLNVVLCNAGVSGPQTPTPADNDTSVSLDQWRDQQLAVDFAAYQDTFKVNTTAVWFTAVTFLKLLDAGNQRKNVEQTSQIVVTTSVASFNRKAPGGWAYGQSKAAAMHAMKQLASLLPRWGVRVNSICPGFFPSEMTTALIDSLGGITPGQTVIPIEKTNVPLGRIGDDKDMAGTVLYAVSRAGAYLNGNVLLVDGGRLGTFPATY